ncbi:MAG: IS21-like element helper ATPase IstB [Legionella sp.]|nr:IS21-like element helper ATPase IstB [Legionella sp.]
MLIHPMLEQLKRLKFTGMLEALDEQLKAPQNDLSFEDRLSLLLDHEENVRTNRLMESRLRQAKLHITQATLADIDYNATRQLDKRQIATFSTKAWVEQKHNVIFTGATGTGKTYFACALAHKACLMGYRAQYWRVTRLLEELELARADGRYLNIVRGIARMHLIVLDDWGMVKLQGEHQQLLLDILDDRYQKASTVVTSQLPVNAWYEQIADKTFADAILDRLLGRAQIIQLSGPSMRQKMDKEVKT